MSLRRAGVTAAAAVSVGGVLPMLVAIVAWFPLYARVHGFSLRRSVVASTLPMLALAAVAVAVAAAWKARGG